MIEELPKVYDPQSVEQKWYKFWEEAGLFSPDRKTAGPQDCKTPFTIVIPPPNITGSLHMGHALNNSIQDLLIRYKRMCGFRALWVPGTDHAGIATQNMVERELKKEGKTKDNLGREAFVDKVWEWKKEYGGKITQQLRRLGSSCDWSRERFTMDEGLTKAVKRHFVQLYREGLIYRGKRIINWCPRCQTALSDIEVVHESKKGLLWFIKYPLATHPPSPSLTKRGGEEGVSFIVVATTRPETMLGDTAVAINPKDERYKHLWGKTVELPLVGRKIPIIKDDFVDLEFGTGAVKVTPAHDPNDYEMGMRHNLPFVNILTPDGHITFTDFNEGEKGPLRALEGKERLKAREEVVRLLEAGGYLVKIEDYENSVGHCYRCKTMIEPYLSDQWFVKIQPLAEKAIAAVEEGKIRFVPERWTKVYLQWMTNLKDWCISRQLWWGHRIPAWYCKSQIINHKLQTNSNVQNSKTNECNEIIVSETQPEKCPKCGGTDLVQDPDVFDTWFSSALWPFSTLGWPEETEDLKTFYPTDVLVTSYDIIFFWVARMIMAGLHFMKKEPFHTVYFNPLVKDVHGKKMSKSWGNVIDPLEVINHAGADALRFAFLSMLSGQGQDLKLSEDKITEARNFANKIWNVSRFVLMNNSCKLSAVSRQPVKKDLSLVDRWIMGKYNTTIKKVTEFIDAYEFGEGAHALYDFIWGDFCDWYVEFSKLSPNKEITQQVLTTVLEGTLRLLHPFMPFITEEIWQKLVTSYQSPVSSIMVAPWPKVDEQFIDANVEAEVDLIKEVIRRIRNIRAEMNVPAGKECEAMVVASKREIELLKHGEIYFQRLSRAKVTFTEKLAQKPKQAASAIIGTIQIYVPLAGLIDFDKEKQRLQLSRSKLVAELERIEKRLSNPQYLSKAEPEKVEEDKSQAKALQQEAVLLSERINSLGS